MNDEIYEGEPGVAEVQKRGLAINAAKLGIILILYDIIFLYLSKKAFLYLYYWCATRNLTRDKTVINAFYANTDNFSSYSAFEMIYSCCVVLMSLILVLIAARIMGVKLLSAFKSEEKGAAKGGITAFPVALIINSAVTTIVSFVVNRIESSGTVIPSADFSISDPNAAAIVFEALYLVVVAPLAEELIYRGLVLKTIAPYGKKIAIFVSALFFGLMHGNIKQFIGAFICGIIFASVDIKYGSIIPSLIIHSLNNALPTIYNIGSAVDSKILMVAYYVLLYSIMFVGIYIFLSKYKTFTIGEEPETSLTNGDKIKAITLNIPTLYAIYLLYVLIGAIVTANV